MVGKIERRPVGTMTVEPLPNGQRCLVGEVAGTRLCIVREGGKYRVYAADLSALLIELERLNVRPARAKVIPFRRRA